MFRGIRAPAAAPFGNLGDGATVGQLPNRTLGVERRQAESVPDPENRGLEVPAG